MEEFRISHPVLGRGEAHCGFFVRGHLRIQASRDKDWEHVSVSVADRTPTWSEMCLVKDWFWDDEEVVMQLHPRASVYVNCHPHCLHLWRPRRGMKIPEPESFRVGPRGATASAKSNG